MHNQVYLAAEKFKGNTGSIDLAFYVIPATISASLNISYEGREDIVLGGRNPAYDHGRGLK